MATKAKWNYKRSGGWVPEISESLKLKLSALLSDEYKQGRFLDALHTHQHIYVIHKDDREEAPTIAEMKKAADEINKDVEKLLTKLVHEAGGVRPHLDYYLMKEMKWLTPAFGVRELSTALQGLVRGCERVLEIDRPKVGSKSVSPEKVFAWRVAVLFIRILNETPTKYIPDDLSIVLPEEKREGKYARVLSACFIDANGFTPGNLKEIAYWGIDRALEK